MGRLGSVAANNWAWRQIRLTAGRVQSESGATLDDIAELLRQNPDLSRLLEDVQTAALASRPAVAPPASHA